MINREKIGRILSRSGMLLIAVSLFLFLFIFSPVIREEIRYYFYSNNNKLQTDDIILNNNFENKRDVIIPADKDFSIIIPKIGANAPVIKNVDPFNGDEYRKKLTQGAAHAKGTAVPSESGNTFLFAHSSDNFYSANRYNTIFYLIHKLKKDDHFFIVYNEEIYDYVVSEVSIISADAGKYLKNEKFVGQSATLMTCWPPGTVAKRLLITGELEGVKESLN